MWLMDSARHLRQSTRHSTQVIDPQQLDAVLQNARHFQDELFVTFGQLEIEGPTECSSSHHRADYLADKSE